MLTPINKVRTNTYIPDYVLLPCRLDSLSLVCTLVTHNIGFGGLFSQNVPGSPITSFGIPDGSQRRLFPLFSKTQRLFGRSPLQNLVWNDNIRCIEKCLLRQSTEWFLACSMEFQIYCSCCLVRTEFHLSSDAKILRMGKTLYSKTWCGVERCRKKIWICCDEERMRWNAFITENMAVIKVFTVLWPLVIKIEAEMAVGSHWIEIAVGKVGREVASW